MKPNARPMLVIKREKLIEVYADKLDAAPVSTLRIRRESRLDLIRYAATAVMTAGVCLALAMIDDCFSKKKRK